MKRITLDPASGSIKNIQGNAVKNIPQVLICDDDSMFQFNVKHSLKGRFECHTAYHCDEAVTILKKRSIDIVLLDIYMREVDEGLHAIPRLLAIDPDVLIVINSSIKDFRIVREAMRLGAIDYIVKDFDKEDLLLILDKTLEHQKLKRRNEQQNFETHTIHQQKVLIGESRPISILRRTIEKVRKSTANVIIFGETGTGKELIARQLRRALPDSSLEPFLAIDSSTIQSTMAESILFGHEKGAFTGATHTTKGIFEEANGGTVYFDEISNMPLPIQAKLLRVLQEKEIIRLGSSRAIRLSFRTICATNKCLESMVGRGEFKDDLLQRLNVIPIKIPPLRDRLEDIPLLIEYFIKKHCGEFPLVFHARTIKVFQNYSWPGNVRELENQIAYLATMFEGNEVLPEDLPERFQMRENDTNSLNLESHSGHTSSYYEHIATFEASLLKEEYKKYKGNISRLAEALEMDRSHLYKKLKNFGIYSSHRTFEKDPHPVKAR